MRRLRYGKTMTKPFKEIHHVSVGFPKGFLASGLNCGIKMTKKDLALIFSETPAAAAGTFTTNILAAAPVRWCREMLRRGYARAIIINSGNANACTGEGGFRDARKMAKITADALGFDAKEVLVSSTGVIGKRLPMSALEVGIPKASEALSKSGDLDAAQAIMTTDSFVKTAAVEFTLGSKKVRLGAIAKGAGMIQPDMATMLCYITTDAAIELEALKTALRSAVEISFNRITVDGDMSTNDSVIVLANGLAGNPPVTPGSAEYGIFVRALEFVTTKLAKMMARDGEGATKLVEVRVTGSPTPEDARRAAFAIANSNLFKVSLYSQDPNWGRLMAALGSARVNGMVAEKIHVKFNGRFFVRKGKSSGIKLGDARKVLRARQINIQVDLGLGKCQETVWTCDLTHKYIDINM